MSTEMNVDQPQERWLDTVEGEIAFFRAIMSARPVGTHRHFHALSIRNAVMNATGKPVTVDEVWSKLGECYNLDLLESLVCTLC